MPPIDFKALAAALLARAEHLVPIWLPGGARRSHEWVCGSLSGGKGGSCSVNLVTGAWADFSADDLKGGDLLSLYAAVYELSMAQAALQIAREEGLESVANIVSRGPADRLPPPPRPPAPPPSSGPQREPEGWRSMIPVPDTAPRPTFRHFHRQAEDILSTSEYRLDGALLGYVVRFRDSKGGKEDLPYTWCQSERDGSAKWHWRQWDAPRPLYMPGGRSVKAVQGDALQPPTVVLVEGERCARVLQALLDGGAPGVYVVVSWPGGSKAWGKALWDWIADCTVICWPDCDSKHERLSKAERDACGDDEVARAVAEQAKPLLPEHKQPGMAAMLGIGALLRAHHGCTVQLLPIPKPGEVADGWDCADAIEVDAWDLERVLAFFGHAKPLPDLTPEGEPLPAPAPPPAPAAAKKNDSPADAEQGGDERMPWWLRPYWNARKGIWMASRKLVIQALRNDPQLEGILGLNELTNNVDARRAWPWPHGEAGPVKGSTALMLGQYLSDAYGLPSISVAALEEAITTVAQSNRFHPVREYLQSLKHDDKPRMDRWLIHVLGETPATLPPQMVEYLGLVGRFLLLGLVRRVMEPGCKFDYCAVLEGGGGLGKSTFVKTLGSKPFFSDAHFDLTRGKEGQEQVQGVWVYELQELSSLGKAELNLIKAFISSEDDRYRPSYGRTVEKFPRQCVMIGTTNEDRYLRDRTGNRRWWPVPVRHVINNPWLERHRDQLLAEAFALYQQGVPYTPTREQEARLFVPMQESRLEETAVASELLHVLTRDPTAAGSGLTINNLTEAVTNAQLCHALGVDAAKSSAALVREIGSWMKHQGWKQQKRTLNGARVLMYVRPRRWPQEGPAGEVAHPDDWTGGLDSLPPPLPAPDGGQASAQDADDAPF